MKSIFKTIMITALALFLGMSSYAQENSNKDKLIGTWTLDYSKTINDINAEAKQYFDNLQSDRKQRIQTSFSQRKMIFEADGSYTIVINEENQVTGTWNLKQDGLTLEIVTEGNTETHSIEKISNQNLELNLEISSEAKQLFNTWHLDKVSN